MKFISMAVLVLWLGSIAYSGPLYAVDKNDAAPAFTLPLLQEGADLSLADFKGKLVYLDFWASWCKPCLTSFPKLEALQNKYKGQGLEIIAINLDQKNHKALEFIAKNPVSYTLLYDESTSVAQAYNVQAMPSSYFIDRKGTVRLIHRGFRTGDEKQIEKAILALLNE